VGNLEFICWTVVRSVVQIDHQFGKRLSRVVRKDFTVGTIDAIPGKPKTGFEMTLVTELPLNILRCSTWLKDGRNNKFCRPTGKGELYMLPSRTMTPLTVNPRRQFVREEIFNR